MIVHYGAKCKVESAKATTARYHPNTLNVKIKFKTKFPSNCRGIVYKPLNDFVKNILESWEEWNMADIEVDMADL